MTDTKWIPTKEVQEVPGMGIIRKEVAHGGQERWMFYRIAKPLISKTFAVLSILAFTALIMSIWNASAWGVAVSALACPVFLVFFLAAAFNEGKAL